MAAEKVLVLNATGKVGRNVCRALLEAGFEVYRTTRSPNSPLAGQGVTPSMRPRRRGSITLFS